MLRCSGSGLVINSISWVQTKLVVPLPEQPIGVSKGASSKAEESFLKD